MIAAGNRGNVVARSVTKLTPAQRRAASRGVTLIELIVVMVVIGILAAIAVPSYRQYVVRSHRVEATSALLNIAAAQEKFYLQCNRYTTSLTGPINGTCGTVGSPGTRGLGLTDFDTVRAGVQTENGWYTLSVPTATAAAFTLSAAAVGAQLSDDGDCATFGLDSTGLKSATTGKCWK